MEIDKIALIYIRGRKLLVVFSKGKDTFFMPGGKREKNETAEQALVRELREELSVDIIPESIKFFSGYSGPAFGKPGDVLKMRCYMAEFTGEIKPASEIERIAWIDSKTKEKSTLVGRIIIEDLKRKNLVD